MKIQTKPNTNVEVIKFVISKSYLRNNGIIVKPGSETTSAHFECIKNVGTLEYNFNNYECSTTSDESRTYNIFKGQGHKVTSLLRRRGTFGSQETV